ncbi:MAG: hypothetical protein RI947_1160 [Candidatus Parcubacteria bacterium]|jgi:glycosyltransferase involved in cell wall biosynthesis
MKIALTGILTRSIGRQTYGGTEAITYHLVEELVKRGHDITLYAASDSEVSSKLISVCSSSTARIVSMNGDLAQPYSMLLSRKLAEDANKYDIIHNNFFHTYILSAFAPFIKVPLVHTIHNSYYTNKDWTKALKSYKTLSHETYVFVSKYGQQRAAPFPRSTTIYNGIDEKEYAFNPISEDYALWLGRMVPEKGADLAIQAIKQTGRQLILTTVPMEVKHNEYLNHTIAPLLDDSIALHISTSVKEKIQLYQHARVFLFPITWEEPFGLVMVEAMSCGTPVIAFARGSAAEVIEDGVTGFIINPSDKDIRGSWKVKQTGIEGIREAVDRIYTMSDTQYTRMRRACRKRVEKNFTIQKMMDAYERLYRSILKTN